MNVKNDLNNRATQLPSEAYSLESSQASNIALTKIDMYDFNFLRLPLADNFFVKAPS